MTTETDGPSPFHPGEAAIQTRLGIRDKVESIGRRIIRDFMPEEHRLFFAQLPWVVVGSVAADGRPWASLLAATPGFIASPDPRTLVVRARPSEHDPLARTLATGAPLALLGIDLATRRRNRANGRVVEVDDEGFRVSLSESFGNCPKYIQVRTLHPVAVAPAAEVALTADGRLTAWARGMIEAADTIFVASYVEQGSGDRRSADVSHRGGAPGFLRVGADDAVTVPDFIGNFLFNTLGNLLLNPRAGLLVPDFRSGDLLHLSGDTEIVWDGPEVDALPGAERLWRFRPRAGVGVRGALSWRE